MFRANPQHTGVFDNGGIVPTNTELWRFAIGGLGWDSSPAVSNGVVYVGGYDGNLYAIDAMTGKEKWRFATGDQVWSSPAVANGIVYVGSWDNNVYAIDAVTGTEKWRYKTGDQVWSSPAVANGVVYVGSYDKNIYAIDAVTGIEKWRFATGDQVWSSPAVANGIVYFGSWDNNVYAIDTVTEKQKWRFKTGKSVGSSPAVSNGVVYVGSGDNNLYAIDAVTGTEKWRFKTGGPVLSSPAVSNSVVYVGSGDNNLYAIDAVTGKEKWLFKTGGRMGSSPAVSNGVVYVVSEDGNLYAVGGVSSTAVSLSKNGDSNTQDSNALLPIHYILVLLILTGGGYGIYRMKKKPSGDLTPVIAVEEPGREQSLPTTPSSGAGERISPEDLLNQIASVEQKASALLLFRSPVQTLLTEAKDNYHAGNYGTIQTTLRTAEDAISSLVQCEARIRQWKKEGYITTPLESLKTDNLNTINTAFRDFEQDLATLTQHEHRVQELKRSYSTEDTDPSISQRIASIESQLHDPRNIPGIEREIETIQQMIRDQQERSRQQKDTEQQFSNLQSKAETLARYVSLTTGSFTEAQAQIAAGNYDEARQTLRMVETTIDTLLECESTLAVWKAEGYITTELEELHPENTDELLSVFRQYTQAIHQLETLAQEFKSTKESNPQLIEQPENARIILSIEQNLKNPDRIDTTEKDIQRLNETIRQQVHITKLKEKAHNLLAETEQLLQVPASIKTALQALDEPTIESAIKEIETLRTTAKPSLALALDQNRLSAGEWHKVEIQVKNTGSAHAVDINLSFSDDFDTRWIEPTEVESGKTAVITSGILPKKKGNIPLEISCSYKDKQDKPYQQKFRFWIDVTDRMTTTPGPSAAAPSSSPVSQFTPKPLTPKQLPPDLADRYTESEFIGQGGFARVFKAKTKDGKYVAVKIPISMDAATGKSFIAEMQNWTKLSHPNIVRLYDFNIMPTPFFEEELCDNALADQNKPIESEEAALIMFNVCEGLKFAHARKIIHRDLKPQNILLINGVPKISDWGLSRIVSESTSTTVTPFTPFYAAPEQINNRVKDERTDIWQIGVILYELVTGVLPFTGDSIVEVMAGIVTKNPQLPSLINPSSHNVEAIIMRCLEKDPGKRYQSVLELQKDLALYLRITYTESLKKSVTAKDYSRSAYYCGDLVMVNLLTGDMKSAYKYLLDLVSYFTGDMKVEAQELSEQIKMRMDMGLTEIPDELIQKAEFIVHKVNLHIRNKG